MQSAGDLVEKFKRQPFMEGLLPFKPALKELGTPQAAVYAEDAGRQRWIICSKKTRQPAVFSHAALVAEAHNLETGNFVPYGQEVPNGVEIKSLQRRANSNCFYTYMFDTGIDISLYEGQWMLDDYMRTVEGFVHSQLPRRPYLSGQETRYRSRFWMQTPMFLKWGPKESRVAPPKYLHNWVLAGKHTVPIADCNPNTLQRGDAVAFSFTVTYHKTSAYWFPQFHPADIIVLKRAEVQDDIDYSAPALDLNSLPPPTLVDLPEDETDATDQPHTPETLSTGSEDGGLSTWGGRDAGGAAAPPIVPAEIAGVEESQQVAGVQDTPSDYGVRDPDGEFVVVESGEGRQGRSSEEFVNVTDGGEDKRGSTGRATRTTNCNLKRN